MKNDPEIRIMASISLSEMMHLGLVLDGDSWKPLSIIDELSGADVEVPSHVGMKPEAEKELDEVYITKLFNELHRMLIASRHTPEGMYDQLDAMHHDYQEAKHLDKLHGQPDGPPCDHSLKDTSTLKYVADYAAPGYGKAFACQVCGEEFAVIGLSVYPASDMAHIMDPSDIE